MTHIDLCSGIGGFALAARWIGWQTIQFCEIDAFCQKVLAKNFQEVPIHGDLKTFNAAKFLGFDGILTAGYPCQPFSQAGKRQGEKDERHLWPEVLRIITECRPAFVVCENVVGHVALGLDQVLSDLEGKGYKSQPFVIPACAVGAPHRRDRVWIVGYANGDRLHSDKIYSRANNARHVRKHSFLPRRITNQAFWDSPEFADNGNHHGLSFGMDEHRRTRGKDKRHFPVGLEEHRLHALGNAIVPQVAFAIFQAIKSAQAQTEARS